MLTYIFTLWAIMILDFRLYRNALKSNSGSFSVYSMLSIEKDGEIWSYSTLAQIIVVTFILYSTVYYWATYSMQQSYIAIRNYCYCCSLYDILLDRVITFPYTRPGIWLEDAHLIWNLNWAMYFFYFLIVAW